MKLFTNKGTSKKIIILLVVMIIFNALAPLYHVLADEDDDEDFGGELFRPIFRLISAIADLLVRGLQSIFIGNGDITIDNPGGIDEFDFYSIRYGPAAIFSNVIPGLDANFINPKYTDKKDKKYQVMGISGYSTVNEYQEKLRDKYPTNFDDFMKAIFDILGEKFDDDAKNEILIEVDAGYEGQNEFQFIVLYKNNCIRLYDTDGDDDEIDALAYIISGNVSETSVSQRYTYYEFVNLFEYTKIPTKEEAKTAGLVENEGDYDIVEKYYGKNGFGVFEGCIKDKAKYFWESSVATVSSGSFSTTYNIAFDELASRLEAANIGFDRSNKTIDLNGVWTWEYNGEEYRVNYTMNYLSVEDARVSVDYEVLKETSDTTYSTGETKVSTSFELRNRISTWYKGLRAVALVGLLSVLVYVGIRILISSTGQEKAKYKKMIADWITAICILFLLHYIMAFTMTIVEKLTDVFQTNALGENQEDILMSTIRNRVSSYSYSGLTTFTNLILYLVLVVYTVLFTIQYLKRLVYLAFFTMIAPLIALTYPIDKIKDGQAQAFSMWLKEYIFNALLPVIHLIIYSIFVGSAISFATSNPVYAIVCIGFLLTAEKFFKKLFGFDKATTTGQLGAAAGGALIMNAINKMGQRSGKQAAGKASGGSDNSGDSTPRYIAPPGGTPVGTPSGGASGGTPVGTPSGGASGGAPVGTPSGGASGGAPVGTPSGGASGGAPVGTPSGGASGGASGASRQMWGQDINDAVTPTKSRIGGVRNVAGGIVNKKNIKNGAKTLGRMTRKIGVGALGATALGTVGLAAGIATGDFSNAFKYAGAGALAGYMGANKVGDTVTNKGTQAGSFIKDTYKEGKWGTDELNTKKSIKELRNDHDFNKVCNQLGIARGDRNKLIREFHSNGITKSEDIKKAFNARLKTGTSHEQVIAAQKIRKEAERYGMKKKDIRQSLINKGVTGSDLTTAMKLIDML